MIDLLIVAPLDNIKRQVPRGFILADEVFSEANIKDPISAVQSLTSEITKALAYLVKRYPRQLRTRWVELWSFSGMWYAFRFRLREFPAIVVSGKEILSGDQLHFHPFCDFIATMLSTPSV